MPIDEILKFKLPNGEDVELLGANANGRVDSSDGQYAFLPGYGPHGNLIYRVALNTGEVAIVSPKYITALCPMSDGLIVKWAEGEFRFYHQDFIAANKSNALKPPIERYRSLKAGAPIRWKIFADHYQFWIGLGKGTLVKGENVDLSGQRGMVVRSDRNFIVRTEHDLNSHEVWVALGTTGLTTNKTNILSEFEVELSDGCFQIGNFINNQPLRLRIPKGRYLMRVMAYDRGHKNERYYVVWEPVRPKGVDS